MSSRLYIDSDAKLSDAVKNRGHELFNLAGHHY